MFENERIGKVNTSREQEFEKTWTDRRAGANSRIMMFTKKRN